MKTCKVIKVEITLAIYFTNAVWVISPFQKLNFVSENGEMVEMVYDTSTIISACITFGWRVCCCYKNRTLNRAWQQVMLIDMLPVL